MNEFDYDRRTRVVFEGNDLEDVLTTINQYLENEEGGTPRLPETPEGLTPKQKQTILDFAATLAWRRGGVDDGLRQGWEDGLKGVPLRQASA